MKKEILTLLVSIISLSLYAIPAYRGPHQIKQKDGSILTLYNNGDEHFHYLTDDNGKWYAFDESGQLVETAALSEAEVIERRESAPTRIRQRQREAANEVNLAPHGLVILVNFTNSTMHPNNTRDEFDRMMNEHNYTYQAAKGSVRDYFAEQSFGKYQPTFDVVGPVTLDTTYQYYGTDYAGQDRRPGRMIADACKKADTEFNVDFTRYDNDNNGEVDFVFVFYAGHGQADNPTEPELIWPHMSYVKDGSFINCVLDGKTINQYACGNELPFGKTDIHVGISTACHEFSHVMGLPDMYNTEDDESPTLGRWDVMDAGPYNNKGRTPPAYSGYERFYCGFVTPTVLNSPCDVTLTEIQRSGQVLLITSTGQHNLEGDNPNPATFYVLENRQKTKWDRYLPGRGLLITKIQYNTASWLSNRVNINARSRIEIQAADSVLSIQGDANDTYPGGKKVTSFTPVFEQYTVTDITEKDSVIHFKFMGGGEEIYLSNDVVESEKYVIRTLSDGIIIDNLNSTKAISVYDITGQIISEQKNTDTTIAISLNKGIYIIKIDNEINKIIIR